MSIKKTLIVILALFVVLIGAMWLRSMRSDTVPSDTSSGTDQVACTLEAKLCPDGSYVGRTGPNCEFSACPGTVPTAPTAGTKTYSDPAKGITFQYPASLGLTYVTAVDWPPAVQILDDTRSCVPAGNETDRAGKTTNVKVGDRTYCKTVESEGAAGSTYMNYAYSFPENQKEVILTFSVREPQCANYDEPNQGQCRDDQNAFNPDTLIAGIADTVILK